MYGYVYYDNDADDIDWNDEIPFQGESPILFPGDYVSTELTLAELQELDPDDEYHVTGDRCFLGGYVPKDGESGILSLTVGNETINNFVSWDDLPDGIRGHLK